MSSPILYQHPLSPPSRAVLITAKTLGLDLELKDVNFTKLEQFKPEFLKLNPAHTIPILIDTDGTIIRDSHAINTYLVGKYAEDDSLYPNDLAKRALVDNLLHYDSSFPFPLFLRMASPIVYHGKKVVDQEVIDQYQEVYDVLEKFLEGNEWIAGDSLTVADFSLLTTITAADKIFVPIDANKFPNIASWIRRGVALPAYSVNIPGLNESYEFFTKRRSG